MKKNMIYFSSLHLDRVKLFKRKLILLIFLCIISSVFGRIEIVDVTVRNGTVLEAIEQLKDQCNINFVYSPQYMDVDKEVTLDVKGEEVSEILDDILEGTNLTYMIDADVVAIRPITSSEEVTANQVSGVTGTVLDAFGSVLPGVTVVVQGTSNGVVTDVDGNFIFEGIKEGDVLQFAFIGMLTKSVIVGTNSTLSIVLEEDAISLNEVVAIGYGTTTKRKAVGSMSTLNAEALEQTAFSNASEALQGQVPGLIVHSSGGAPGDLPSISIRGGGTPLFVIDGVVSDESDFGMLNTDDIESVTFLKDAASTAVYGSRAGDGIVLVKTKVGKNGTVRLNYSANFQLSQPTMLPAPMTGIEWANMSNDAARYDEIDPIYSPEQLKIIANGSDPYTYANTNWQDEALKNFATQNKHNLSLVGGDKRTNYFVSLGYLDQNGLLKSNAISMDRYNIRSNVNTSFEKIGLDVGLNINGSLQKNREPSVGQASIFRQISYLTSPLNAVYNPDGSYASGANPVALADMESGYIKNTRNVINTQLNLTWQVPGVEGLVAGVMGAYRNVGGFYKKWALTAPQYEPSGELANSLAPSLAQKSYYQTVTDFETRLAYNKNFKKHGIDATLVYTQRQGYYEEMEASKVNYESSAVDMLFAGPSEGQSNSGKARENALAGVVGRVKYDFDSKYVLELSGRYDGNDNFAPDQRWGFFPALGAAWILSSESFMSSINDRLMMNTLKLRYSYGVTGIVDGVNRFGYLSSYNLVPNVLNIGNTLYNGYSEGDLVNPEELTWYSRKSSNVGVDYAFFENSIEGSFDYFYYETTGFLVNPEDRYSSTLGKDLPQISSDSEHRRSGIEASLRYKRKIKDWFFSVGANCSYYDQLWAKKADENMASLMNPYVRETQQKDYFRSMYSWDGYYQDGESVLNTARPVSASSIQMGDLRYVDANGDGKINEDDMRRVGKPDAPHFNYGVDFMASYKGFSLSGLVQGTGDRYVDLGLRSQVPKEILLAYQSDYWSETNPDAQFQRISTSWDNPNGLASTHKLMNARYVRLKNIQLSYDLKEKILTNFDAISQFKIFVTGTNLLTFSDVMDYFDPESYMSTGATMDGNVAGSTYPVQKTYTFGMSLQF